MQNSIEPNGLEVALRSLLPRPLDASKMELWYRAGFSAAQARARRWHMAAMVMLTVVGLFAWYQPSAKVETRFVDRAVYLEPLPQRSFPQPASLDDSISPLQIDDFLQEKMPVITTNRNRPDSPVMCAWMTDTEFEKFERPR